MTDIKNPQEANPDIIKVPIEQELTNSYIDYAMSVITSRAIPDVRDGLKNVQRRVLYAMYVSGNTYDKPFRKSARTTGEVLSKYHPHSNEIVYETIVRMAQDFLARYPLVVGQGNFGSIDGDAPAAMRYTAIKMSKVGEAMVADIDKDTVSFSPNYDDTDIIPDILPAKLPNLMINGTSGIAVGFSTSIPPHNLTEIIQAAIALIDNSDLTVEDLCSYVVGPDFPTGGLIFDVEKIHQIYRTGKGSITLRAKTHIDHVHNLIYVTELPFQVNKAVLVEQIATLVNQGTIENITDVIDESDKQGISIKIVVKKHCLPEVVLNNLFNLTKLQSYFHCNFIALDRGSPKLFSLKTALQAFIDHRLEVITKRTNYLLAKAQQRLIALQGTLVAVANIETVVQIIKTAASIQEARTSLLNMSFDVERQAELLEKVQLLVEGVSNAQLRGTVYNFSEQQVNAILELRLTALTSLERKRVSKSIEEILSNAYSYIDLLADRSKRLDAVKEELLAIEKDFVQPRRTILCTSNLHITDEELIVPEEVIVTLSGNGYLKCQKLGSYIAQHRGGIGKLTATFKEEQDYIINVLTVSRRDTLLCFSNLGRVFWLKTYTIPLSEQRHRGRPVQSLFPLIDQENIIQIIPLQADPSLDLVFVTRLGIVKRTSLAAFAKPRTSGLKAIAIQEGNSLLTVLTVAAQDWLMLFTTNGRANMFKINDIRSSSRSTIGVKGIRCETGHCVVAATKFSCDALNSSKVLVVTARGYGKFTSANEYRTSKRGTKGVKTIALTSKNGNIIGAAVAQAEDETSNLLLVTQSGILNRIRSKEIPVYGRATQGVKLIELRKGDEVTSMSLTIGINLNDEN